MQLKGVETQRRYLWAKEDRLLVLGWKLFSWNRSP
jgi:hypothetical protein